MKQSAADKLLIVSSGATLHESLKAAQKLEEEGINVRVLDPFTLKPFDADGVESNALEAGGVVLTVEEHYKEGGIHELVCSTLSLKKIPVHGLYVTKIPGSATPEEQLQIHGLDSASIVTKVKTILA